MSETVDLLGFSADKSFLGLIKNSPKKIKYPLSSTSLGEYALLMSKENGQIRKWPDKKPVPQITTCYNRR